MVHNFGEEVPFCHTVAYSLTYGSILSDYELIIFKYLSHWVLGGVDNQPKGTA